MGILRHFRRMLQQRMDENRLCAKVRVRGRDRAFYDWCNRKSSKVVKVLFQEHLIVDNVV